MPPQETTSPGSFDIRHAIAKPDNCSKCGFCLNACPVYSVFLTESASPRGKIQLSRRVLDGDLDLSDRMKEILSRCLMCGSCSAACPSGVQGAHLFSGMRWLTTQALGLDWHKKALYRVLAHGWMRSASARLAGWAKTHFDPLIRRQAASHPPLAGVPAFNGKPFSRTVRRNTPAAGRRRARVLYFHGCATNYLYEDVGRAVVAVLSRMGVEVVTPADQGCCGIPIILSGARELALKSIKEVLAVFARRDVDAVIVDCATCGSALGREYLPMLREMRARGEAVDDATLEAAALLAEKTRDIMAFVAEHREWLPLPPPSGQRAQFTYHDPCHLAKGQGVGPQLRPLFQSLTHVEFVEMQDPDACCGGGGVFQVDHPQISAAITAKKAENIRRTGADFLATGCPGCRMTIGAGLAAVPGVRVVHPVQLLLSSLPRHSL